MNIQSMTLGQKIAAGYTLLIGITLGLGLMSLWNMWSGASRAHALSSQYIPETSLAAALQEAALTANLQTRSYALTGKREYLDQANASLKQVTEQIHQARKLSNEYPGLTKLREEIDILDKKLALYRKALDATATHNETLAATIQAMTATGAQFTSTIESILRGENQHLKEEIAANAGSVKLQEQLQKITLLTAVEESVSHVRLASLRALSTRDRALLADSLKHFSTASQYLGQLDTLTKEVEHRQELNQLRAHMDSYKEAAATLLKCYQDLDTVDRERNNAAEELTAATQIIIDTGFQRTVTTANSSSSNLSSASGVLMVGLVTSILAGMVLSFLITRGITATVRAIIQSLSTSSEQTASAAGEISQASQSLAESSSEQAASLEETSASLEEMAGMTKLNAENAAKAKSLADQTRNAADAGAEDMRAMTVAMDEIKQASDSISKIIKTIDEIAFQTNILALNAAVEAARAGEAGMGFAVVADEVRHLAQRSAQAAKETAQRIEESIAKSEHGVQISSKVAASLRQIVTKAREVDEIVAEIATASREQSKGIDQVNIAVSQMDKVTQSNAANAEQTASASEQLSAQSQELQSAVHDLLTMVGSQSTSSIQALPAPRTTIAGKVVERSQPANSVLPPRSSQPAQSTAEKTTHKRITHERSIPLEQDFKNI